jgi:hypothetical protein
MELHLATTVFCQPRCFRTLNSIFIDISARSTSVQKASKGSFHRETNIWYYHPILDMLAAKEILLNRGMAE